MTVASYPHTLEGSLRRLDPNDDLDSAHDAWVELCRRSVEHEPAMRALVYRTKKRACDYRRRERLHSAEYLRQRVQVRESPAPDTVNERREKCEMVRARVARLPVRYREVVMLRYFDDLSIAEIARKLGLAVEAVYKRLERARRKLASDPVLNEL